MMLVSFWGVQQTTQSKFSVFPFPSDSTLMPICSYLHTHAPAYTPTTLLFVPSSLTFLDISYRDGSHAGQTLVSGCSSSVMLLRLTHVAMHISS